MLRLLLSSTNDMPVVTQVFRDAQALAKFSNLEPNKVEDFRHNYADFAPQAWWDYKLTLQELLLRGNVAQYNWLLTQPFWNPEQRTLFGQTITVFTPAELQKPFKVWQLNQSWLREAWNAHFEIELFDVLKLLTSVFNPDDSPKVFVMLLDVPQNSTYYRAISLLIDQKWRARFCEECRNRFVAAESRNKYCSDACSREVRLRQERETWHQNKEKYRPRKKHQKSRGKSNAHR